MKKFFLGVTLAALVTASGCKKSDLQLLNPNSPTPGSALVTQIGIEEYALGIWAKTVTGGYNEITHSLVAHGIMGDEQWASVGNFGWRYANQVNTITLPAPYNTVVPNIFATTQKAQLQSLNNLTASNSANNTNVFVFEWNLYIAHGQANQLLASLTTNTAIPATEKTILQAFGYWWKGLIYSRIGSMYISGIINSNVDGTTNGSYATHDAVVAEGNANFEKAIALLNTVTDNTTYTTVMKAINPAFCTYPTTPAMWVREMYTYEARNLLVNKKVAAMTATDWASIKTLCAKGLLATDVVFAEGMDPNNTSDFSGTQQHVFEWANNVGQPGWTYMSERLVQDFKTGDARRTKGVKALTTPEVNRSSRGIQFGTRYVAELIENGGYWATNTRKGYMNFACSYEENQLMLAEAAIRTSDINTGLGYIDQVRAFQGAGLAAVANTGLVLADAVEELRRERRIALMERGTAFYDARRWGVTAPASAGGGRANAVVLVPNSVFGASNATGYTAMNCFIDYNYMDYWDVPITEVAYNAPATGAAVTVQQ